MPCVEPRPAQHGTAHRFFRLITRAAPRSLRQLYERKRKPVTALHRSSSRPPRQATQPAVRVCPRPWLPSARRPHSFSLSSRPNFANFATSVWRSGEHAFPRCNRRFWPVSAILSPRFSGQFRMFANLANFATSLALPAVGSSMLSESFEALAG